MHVAVATERTDIARVLILAGPDTPYAYGAFVFDVFFPANFPDAPPKVGSWLIKRPCTAPEIHWHRRISCTVHAPPVQLYPITFCAGPVQRCCELLPSSGK